VTTDLAADARGESAAVMSIMPSGLYKDGSGIQLVVCRRFSSHFLNQRARAGLSRNRKKCFEIKALSSSAGTERTLQASVIRPEIECLKMQPDKTARVCP
jgi:hypothetical protein